MMTRTATRALALLMLVALQPGTVLAEDSERATVRKSKEQLNFELPPDWPIERRGGLMQPIPVEEYLAMKFKAFDARLQGMEQRMQALDIRLRLLEQSAQAGASGLKSSEEPKR